MRNPNSPQERAKVGRTGAARKHGKQRQDDVPDLHDFTIRFFQHFGAPVAAVGRRKQHGPLRVALPPDLGEHFGSATLSLAFQNVEEGSGQQLVAHGSRTFDRMLALLKRHSALTVRRLPTRYPQSEPLLGAVRPRNASITSLRLHEQREPLFVFHWRLTYRADDKREELHAVVLDAQGAPVTLGAAESLPSLDDLLASSEPFDEPVVADESAGNGEAAEAPPEPAAPASTASATSAPRLPPLTHLVRLAERARKFAVYHADLRCVAHEADILPRLYKVLNRLTTYYAQQIEEVRDANDLAGERRAALEIDLQRKIAEEVENHRLRVQVELCACAILYQPVAIAEMTLSDGRRAAPVRVRLDRFTGALHRPPCHACGQETDALVLDRNGHVHCDACLRQCQVCQDVLCAACGVEPCPVCGRENCDTCGRSCWACGRRACTEHVSRCPVCGDEVCHACQEPCAECGMRQCRSHLRADAVLEPDGGTRLICASCAVRCPGCRQFSARLGVCSQSGQRFCVNCLVGCSRCGRLVGPGFYGVEAETRLPVCRSCVVICPGCGEISREAMACSACGGECCSACSRECAICHGQFCSEHWNVAEGCGHVLCSEHGSNCAIGGEVVCPTCSESCAICERAACIHHQTPCAWCGRLYCSECVGGESGLCRTCASLMSQPILLDMRAEPAATHADVRALLHKYAWRRASNRAVTVYIGVAVFSSNVVVVVRRGPDGRLVIVTRKLSIRDYARGLIPE